MIFAVITGTPCLVLGNYNYKIKGVYENWIRNNTQNVIFINDVENIEKNIEKVMDFSTEQKLKFDFEDLIKILGEE